MDLTNILIGIGYLRVVLVRQVARIWFPDSKSSESARVLANRRLRELTKQNLLVKSPWIDRRSWDNRIFFRGLAYALSKKGVERALSLGRMDASLTSAVGHTSLSSVSLHSIMVSEVLTSLVSGLRAYHGRVGATLWREAPICGRMRADALIGLIASRAMVTPANDDHCITPAPWVSWETFHAVAQRKAPTGEMAALYALEVDLGYETPASFAYRAAIYRKGRNDPLLPFSIAPLPIIVTTTLERAQRIVEIWSQADSESAVYATDIASATQASLGQATWHCYTGHHRSAIVSMSPFAWLDRVCVGAGAPELITALAR